MSPNSLSSLDLTMLYLTWGSSKQSSMLAYACHRIEACVQYTNITWGNCIFFLLFFFYNVNIQSFVRIIVMSFAIGFLVCVSESKCLVSIWWPKKGLLLVQWVEWTKESCAFTASRYATWPEDLTFTGFPREFPGNLWRILRSQFIWANYSDQTAEVTWNGSLVRESPPKSP